jgi:hypothetical protein
MYVRPHKSTCSTSASNATGIAGALTIVFFIIIDGYEICPNDSESGATLQGSVDVQERQQRLQRCRTCTLVMTSYMRLIFYGYYVALLSLPS